MTLIMILAAIYKKYTAELIIRVRIIEITAQLPV